MIQSVSIVMQYYTSVWPVDWRGLYHQWGWSARFCSLPPMLFCRHCWKAEPTLQLSDLLSTVPVKLLSIPAQVAVTSALDSTQFINTFRTEWYMVIFYLYSWVSWTRPRSWQQKYLKDWRRLTISTWELASMVSGRLNSEKLSTRTRASRREFQRFSTGQRCKFLNNLIHQILIY